MNILEIIVIITIVLCVTAGYFRGFLKTVYSVAAWIFILVFVTLTTPYLTNFLEEHTGLKDTLQETCTDYMSSIADSGDLPIGEFITESGLYDELADQMAHFIIQGIAFFIVMAIVGTVTFSVSHMLNLVARIPLIRGPDKLLGAAAGGLKGLVFVWLLFYMISVCAASEFGTKYLDYIEESLFLKFLYDNNILLMMVSYFMTQ